MTCNINPSALYPEPLPLYSRNDPDAVSIHSAAPSYKSETPTYMSRRLSNVAPAPSLLPPVSPHVQTQGLPAAGYAPGFQSRAPGSVIDINANSFNSGGFSTRTSHNSRQYEAVARRRAKRAASTSANTTAMLNSLSAVPSGPSSASGSPNASSTSIDAYPVTVGSSSEPVTPLEDPYLVGEEAARRARTQRVYREMCLRGEEVARYENRSWEFMIGQMADWEEREQSWRKYRERVGQTNLLGRRLGLRS